MAATNDQRQHLDLLDLDAALLDIEHDLQAVATRLANRGRTPDEGDDVRTLLCARGRLAAARQTIIRQHPDWRR